MAYEKENILIVDDDLHILELLQRHLRSMNYHTYRAASVKQAVQILAESEVDLLITDIRMPEADGLELLRYTSEHFPVLPKLVITGFPSVAGALDVIKSGATDYLSKPFTREELKQAVLQALSSAPPRPIHKPAPDLPSQSDYPDLIGESPAFTKILDTIGRVRDNRVTVLIQGESGTGKELVARAIHYSGRYARGPFVAVNCAAIPQELLEAELFGYTRGAFTGAMENRPGFFQAAAGGTLFLDEIGNASQAVQTRLLRAIQEKEVIRVGSRTPEKVAVRIIAATNADLTEGIIKNTFREDLYYRLSVVQIQVPPLRDRKEDIPVLAKSFMVRYGREYRDMRPEMDPSAMKMLMRYSWPGNIRELENIIQRAVIMSDGRHLGTDDFPDHLKYEIQFAESPLAPLEKVVKDHILKVLKHTGNNKTKAAEILGIDRKTLREKLKE